MKNVTTYVGSDAHKKDLFMAMLVGDQAASVTWTTPNEPRAMRRLVKKLEREAPGPVRVFYEAGTVRLRVAAAGDDGARERRCGRARADPPKTG